jgi:diaminopimelate epimerase
LLLFTKMHGLGNDFIIVDSRQTFYGTQDIKDLCHRNNGIGADQYILLTSSNLGDAKVEFFNQDGSKAEICGNGLRCIGLWFYLENNKKKIDIETENGMRSITLTNIGVKASMGKPEFKPLSVNFIKDISVILESESSKIIDAVILSFGNPHCVIFVNDFLSAKAFEKLGIYLNQRESIANSEIRETWFKDGVNVETCIIRNEEIHIEIWERGSGKTLACGSGACASFSAARIKHNFKPDGFVNMPGGKLLIEEDSEGEVYMTGEATMCFKGMWRKFTWPES